MRNQLLKIREIIDRLEVLNDDDDDSDYTLPEKLNEGFLKIQATLLRIWAAKPHNLEEILDFNFQQASILMSRMSTYTVDKGEIKGLVKGGIGFRYAVNTVILDGLLGVISLIMYFRDGNNPRLGLQFTGL